MAYTQKGECRNTGKTHFQKGMTPWNKNKFLVENTKTRRQPYYTRLVLERSEKPFCNRCNKQAELVHHKNEDWKDNRIENLESLCYSCHAKEHELEKNLPSDGGWSKRIMLQEAKT